MVATFKEIVTKAVVGKGKKNFKNTYTASAQNDISTVLGCWVINHKFKGYKVGEKIGVDGSFDVNIWYSYDNDSKTTVISKKIDYNEMFNVKTKEDADLSGETDIIVRSLKQPTCLSVSAKGNVIEFVIDKELGVELVGETKVKIAVEEDTEVWDDITDDALNDIDEEINEDYIDKTDK